MKTARLIVVLITLGLLGWWLSHESKLEVKIPLAKTNEIATPVEKPKMGSSISKPSDGLPKTPEEFVKMQEREAKSRAENVERGKDEWRTPIEFYGKVVDENSQPVPSVKIHFSCNDISAEGTSDYYAESGADGLFSLKGVKGKLLVLHLTKDSYYVSKTDNTSFEYGDRYAHFIPDQNNPVVFHLRKKGKGEALIVTAGRIKVPLNGTFIEVDLNNGKIAPVGQGLLKLECISDYKHETNGVFNWKLSLSVPGGGIVQSRNEFDFEAPEEGYEREYEIQMPGPKETGWTQMLDRKFFFKLANGNFGRFSCSFIAYNGVFRFSSFINPSGSRNLEYDEAVQSKTKAFE